MFCESPVISAKGYKYPCNKCRACRLAKSNKKMIVSIFAANEYKTKGQFLTLTYNDEHRPDGLNHEHFQSFMKKLRELDGTLGVKYFMAGEYGGDENGTHREHFHVLFYNHHYDIDLVQKAWSEPRPRGRKPKDYVDEYIPFGFVYDGTLTPMSMKYVSGYIDKKGYDPASGKRPPYGRSSCNIPDNLTMKEVVKMCKTGRIHYNGRSFSVPDNWRRRYIHIWRYFANFRIALKNHDIVPDGVPYDFELYGVHWKFSQQKEDKLHNSLSPSQVKSIMDDKEIKYNLRKKKKRRIMSQ